MSNEQTASTTAAQSASLPPYTREENSAVDQVIETWLKSGDQAVAREIRRPMWITMINNLQEKTLKGATVLDFGCSRGAFLETLYTMKPFAQGYGIDVSKEAINAARERDLPFPADFLLGTGAEISNGTIHMAFSYEVIWLLQDLQQHAQFINRVLAPGGVYYAATGCHTKHPRWREWIEIIGSDSTLPPANHSPEDFVQAFSGAGFKVSARELGHRDFVPVTEHLEYFPTVIDAIEYYSKQTLVFRFEKPRA